MGIEALSAPSFAERHSWKVSVTVPRVLKIAENIREKITRNPRVSEQHELISM